MDDLADSPTAAAADTYPTSAFDYDLPTERIARFPRQRRDESRLLSLDRRSGALEHLTFHEIVDLIPAGDTLVLNETRVFPARLLGHRRGGGEAEIFLLHPVADPSIVSEGSAEGTGATLWEALVRPGARLKPGRSVEVGDELRVEIEGSTPDGTRLVRLLTPLPIEEALERYGRIPLPPYIDRDPEPADTDRYQTVYAREPGSVAAPTAGLHLTPELLEALEARGVGIARIVLHVGVGTFRPVESEEPEAHQMHQEFYQVTPAAAATLNATRTAGGRVWAVGTTVTRTLESVVDDAGTIHPGEGWSDLFIRPPYQFRAIDCLITNFHLPRSTLIMLVAALAGYEPTMRAYQEAILQGYRFYSYGDAMVVQ